MVPHVPRHVVDRDNVVEFEGCVVWLTAGARASVTAIASQHWESTKFNTRVIFVACH